ncbi:MAG: sulfatase-like hydrolase/transferase [bacterium]
MHGFQNFIGRDEIFKSNIYYEQRRHTWGVQDIDLMKFIIDWLETKELNKFRLLIPTTNEHEPGYFDPECSYAKKSSHYYISIIRCVDFAFDVFLKWFKNSKYRENIIIIISGDHPAFLPGNNEIANLLVGQHGQMLFGFYHPKKKNIQIHPGSTNDLGTTILELLGFKVEAFRSGNFLLHRKKIFPEIFSHQIKIMDGKYVEVGHCPEKN